MPALSAAAAWAAPTKPAFEWLPFGLLGLALLLAPLPLGSNRMWASALLAAMLLLTLLMVLLLQCAAPVPDCARRMRASAWVPVGLILAHAALLAGQLVPLADALRPLLAPGPDAATRITVDLFATRHHLLKTLGFAAAFVVVMRLATTRWRVQVILLLLLLAGVAQTALAVAMLRASTELNFLFVDFIPGSRARGSFANPDHLAGYMLLCFSAGLGLLLAQPDGVDPTVRGWRGWLLCTLRFIQSPRMLVRLLLVMVVIGLVMTHSRMGNAAFLVALLAVGLLCALRSRTLRRTALWLVASVLVIDLVIIGQWVGLDRVVERLAATPLVAAATASTADDVDVSPWREEALDERLRAAGDALAMVVARPLAGFGGGTFHVAFPPFKGSEHRLGFYDHAHNDYVELAADTGVSGLLLLLLMVVATAWRALRLLGRDADPLARGVAAGVLMAICGLGLHSMVDFNLQIPATALTFTVLLALPWCLPLREAVTPRPRGALDDRHPLPPVARHRRRPAKS